MAAWQSVARESRPAPLTADQANAIRRSVIAAAGEAAQRSAVRRAPAMIIGGMLMSAVTAGVLIARAHPLTALPILPAPESLAPAVVKQLQFSTPGGTRIIWQFDPDFTLRETLP